ncbi:hypothetical protein HII31_12507 [Pseudocercospora fuligena]|uniref:Mid2 domain-containing protein n=1 Tax=Pseudocercospora fuligena TaxID=685502 RepID=A0A8H6VGM2_9PEZI|nr:hypothetical protein HII31_12507 [Pseudocercospora fuligena]
MLRQFTWLDALLTSIPLCNTQSESSQNSFITPPPAGIAQNYDGAPIWHLGDNNQVRWQTTFPTYNVTLWQQDIETNAQATMLSIIYIYFFWINYNWGDQMTSMYFNITSQPLTTITSASATASETGTAVTNTPTQYTSATPIPTSNANVTSEMNGTGASDDASNLALKVGLGLGIGLGVPLVLIAGFWLGRRRRKRSPPVILSPTIEQAENKHAAPPMPEPPNYQVPDPNAVYEMQGPENVAKNENRQSLREME